MRDDLLGGQHSDRGLKLRSFMKAEQVESLDHSEVTTALAFEIRCQQQIQIEKQCRYQQRP